MKHSKLFAILVVGLLVTGTSFAATVTVGPGKTFATINAALESLDYNDGVADVVVIDPGVYEEQVFPKGNAGADSTAFPGSGGLTVAAMQAAIQSHPDPLTLRAADPANPPIITRGATTTIGLYGMFPGDPGDFFEAALVVGAKDVTLSGINLQYGPGGGYAMNGMGTNYTFQDCLFTYGATTRNEDFCDWNNNYQNNSDVDPLIGLDNTFVFDGCIIDGSSTVDGSIFDSSFIWWHGYDDVAKTEVSTEVYNNCVFRYWDDLLHEWRGRVQQGSGFKSIEVSDCFFRAPGDGFEFRGNQGPVLIARNVFEGNGGWFIRVRERDQAQMRELNIVNNIMKAYPDAGGSGETLIRFRNDGQTANGGWTINIVNNTFFNYGKAVRTEGPRGNTACTLLVANNIFMGTDTNPTQHDAIAIGDSRSNNGDNFNQITATLVNNAFFNNATDVVQINGAPSGGITGSVNVDPAFTTDSTLGYPAVGGPTDLNIPDAPLSDADFANRVGRQNFIPTAAALIDGGDNASYDPLKYGNVDVDSLNDRIGNGTIDIGAQETNGASVVAGWDMY